MKRAPLGSVALVLSTVVVLGPSLVSDARADGPAAAPTAAPTARPAPVPAPGPAPAPAPSTPKERLSGVFVHAGGEREVAARDAAIDKATESMFFAIKGVARSKLRERLAVSRSVRVAFADGTITVASEGETVTTSPESGETVSHTSTSGSPAKLSQHLTPDGKLVQKTESEGGSRTSVFTPSADGKVLSVQHTVESPKLPQPVRWGLTYRRR